MSDDVILLKLEEEYTCPITQACLLIFWLFHFIAEPSPVVIPADL